MIVCDLVVKIGLFQGFSRIKDETFKHQTAGKKSPETWGIVGSLRNYGDHGCLSGPNGKIG